ncbi:hypothetical protein SKAU_G00271720 [Synaphobranchus kaupii]|uniref:Uncharacterized protein n=1 Tax=Synaphobranchus kaupii TaxID=118154 RepID=A0A9Q1INM5_SYNKA|nr:hypothetical protein SKAU_G00271720 [Synaphobranchus kaupii]
MPKRSKGGKNNEDAPVEVKRRSARLIVTKSNSTQPEPVPKVCTAKSKKPKEVSGAEEEAPATEEEPEQKDEEAE